MPFVKVIKSHSGGSIPRHNNSIRMSSNLQSKPGTAKSIYIGISNDVIRSVGWKTTRENDRERVNMALHEGVGEDAGFFMLEAADDGYSAGTPSKHSQAFSVSISYVKFKHYVLNECPAEPIDVEFTVDSENKTIIIQAPDWLRYNSLSYTPPDRPQRRAEDRKPSPPPSLHAAGNAIAAEVAPELNRKQRRAMVSKALSAMK